MEEKLLKLEKEHKEKVSKSISLKELDSLFLTLFGKNGLITLLPKKFSKLSREDLQRIGPLFNRVKTDLEKAIEDRREEVREESYKKLAEEKIDITESPKIELRKGHLHPTTRFVHQTYELFANLGFKQFDAPEIDTDKYNFELLNIPPRHPARDLWDTLYVDYPDCGYTPGDLLLRTHTSNSQIRIMRNQKPPIKAMVIGRCYRYENLDARHEHTFEQFELVYIDKGLSMANLQYLSEYFLKAVVGEDIKARLRPKYYPFVEPGFGIDALCIFCKGNGCRVCSEIGWLEIGGAGMIHPQVLQNGGINPNVYSGIAWGPGIERMNMIKYGINDIRLFLKGDLDFLEKF